MAIKDPNRNPSALYYSVDKDIKEEFERICHKKMQVPTRVVEHMMKEHIKKEK